MVQNLMLIDMKVTSVRRKTVKLHVSILLRASWLR